MYFFLFFCLAIKYLVYVLSSVPFIFFIVIFCGILFCIFLLVFLIFVLIWFLFVCVCVFFRLANWTFDIFDQFFILLFFRISCLFVCKILFCMLAFFVVFLVCCRICVFVFVCISFTFLLLFSFFYLILFWFLNILYFKFMLYAIANTIWECSIWTNLVVVMVLAISSSKMVLNNVRCSINSASFESLCHSQLSISSTLCYLFYTCFSMCYSLVRPILSFFYSVSVCVYVFFEFNLFFNQIVLNWNFGNMSVVVDLIISPSRVVVDSGSDMSRIGIKSTYVHYYIIIYLFIDTGLDKFKLCSYFRKLEKWCERSVGIVGKDNWYPVGRKI